MKYLFLLTLLACVALPTVSQTPSGSSATSICRLTREQAPEIRGVHLGMSTEQLLSLFPEDANRRRITEAIRDSKHADNYGVGRFNLEPDKQTANPRWAGINYIWVEMIDERVTTFHVEYVGPEWKTVGQFVAKLSEGLRLPISSWDGGDGWSHLKCDGFRVEAHASRGSTQSSVRVRDMSAPQVVEDRREAAKEKARQAFKP